MNVSIEKLAKILFALFVMVFSIYVLPGKVSESNYIDETIKHLEKSQNTVMTFSGTTIATSLAISALPDDFASPLANTVSDLNTYFVFLFAVLFIEKLIVVEGIKISFVYIIPVACSLYMISILTTKEIFKTFGTKLFILGLSLIMVIPISTHFTETVCADYLVYVDETIAEANAGADKINQVMSVNNEEATFFDKLTNAFKTAIQNVSDLLEYFKNVIRKCVNSIAIMLVTTFVLPLLILMLFRWLLKELFSLHIPTPNIQINIPKGKKKISATNVDFIPEERENQ